MKTSRAWRRITVEVSLVEPNVTIALARKRIRAERLRPAPLRLAGRKAAIPLGTNSSTADPLCSAIYPPRAVSTRQKGTFTTWPNRDHRLNAGRTFTNFDTRFASKPPVESTRTGNISATTTVKAV